MGATGTATLAASLPVQKEGSYARLLRNTCKRPHSMSVKRLMRMSCKAQAHMLLKSRRPLT